MSQKLTPAQYKAAFIRRLRAMRIASGHTQATFAMALGVSRDTYAKYETRSLLPHHLIPRVAELTNQDLWLVLTGESPDNPAG